MSIKSKLLLSSSFCKILSIISKHPMHQEAGASLLCTTLGGDHKKYSPLQYRLWMRIYRVCYHSSYDRYFTDLAYKSLGVLFFTDSVLLYPSINALISECSAEFRTTDFRRNFTAFFNSAGIRCRNSVKS